MTQQTSIITARPDGWTLARQVRFLNHLADCGTVRTAAARVGMSREAAYQLKRREPLFARAWDAALVQAREASAEVLACRALDGVEVDVWYKGERVGTHRKYDSRLLLAHLARLDKQAEAQPEAEADAERFDELLARVAGEEVPPEIAIDDALPPARELAIEIAGEIAADVWEEEPEDRGDPDVSAARRRAEAEAAVVWDEWFARACAAVDRLLDERVDAVRTVSNVATSPANPPRDGEVAVAAGG
jgi:hypothetical protein